MENCLTITKQTSISEEVIPYLSGLLPKQGYALVHIANTDRLEEDMLVISALVGQYFAQHMSYCVLDQADCTKALEVHTECISYTSGVISHFALGCITPSESGGATRVFDARTAADIISRECPELKAQCIEYSSLANPNMHATYPLVVRDDAYGDVLRYRAEVVTNSTHADKETTEHIYRTIDKLLLRCITLEHCWTKGDLLFVNNLTTLHDRLPFTGRRKMLRVRFGDSLNQRIHY